MSYDGPSMGEQVKMHSGWRWPVLIALGVALFGAMFLVYYLGPTAGDISGTNPKPTADATPVALSVVNVNFTIPSNFIQLPKTREGGVRDVVELQALLPNLSPFTTDQTEAFADVSASSRVVNLLLHPNKSTLTEDQRLDRVYLNQVKDRQGTASENGLTAYEFQDETGYATQQLLVGQDSRGAKAVLLCDKASAEVAAPACRRDIDFATGLGLSYEFKRGFLSQWQDIDRRAVDLVISFRTQ